MVAPHVRQPSHLAVVEPAAVNHLRELVVHQGVQLLGRLSAVRERHPFHFLKARGHDNLDLVVAFVLLPDAKQGLTVMGNPVLGDVQGVALGQRPTPLALVPLVSTPDIQVPIAAVKAGADFLQGVVALTQEVRPLVVPGLVVWLYPVSFHTSLP